MGASRVKGVCVFGGFVRGYPRSEVIMKGLAANGVPVHVCHASHKKKLPSRYAALLREYRRLKEPFDVIYVPEFRHKDVPLAHFLSRIGGKRLVFDPLVSRYDTKIFDRGDAGAVSFQAWHNRNIDRLSMALPDVVLADTEAHAEYFADRLGANPAKIKVLRVGYDASLFRPHRAGADERTNGVMRVMFFGSYLPLHGVDVIVAAAALLKHRADIRFEIIGDGQTFASVMALLEREPLNNVSFLGRMPIEALSEHLADAHVCLGIFGSTPKAARVIPNKVYQCMGMGKPVITARSVAVEELFTDGESIVMVAPGDAAALASAVDQLCSDPRRRERIASAGHDAVQAYTSEGIGRRLLDICEDA